MNFHPNKIKILIPPILFALASLFFLNDSFPVNGSDEEKDAAVKVYSEARKYKFNENIIFKDHSGNLTADKLQKIGAKFMSAFDSLNSFYNGGLKLDKINIHVYKSFEQKGLSINNTDIISYSGNSIYIVINDDFSGVKSTAFLETVLLNNFGEPSSRFISGGIAAYFGKDGGAAELNKTAARIIKADAVPSLQFLLDDNSRKYESNFSIEALSLNFAQFILKNYGGGYLKNLYGNRKNAASADKLNREWKEYQRNFAENIPIERKIFPAIPKFLKGFCFAHEGYQIHNGYLSNSAIESLEKLKELGTNTITITPFTGMRNPKRLAPFRIWRSAGSENDESVMFAAKEASKLGISVMLKPHIYIHGSWPGAIEFQTRKEWNEFFDYYFKWIKHYALLAQKSGIPIFVIGNELSVSTLKFPGKWRGMIKKIRAVYDGKITYGANWGKETELIEFWDDLDFIGVSQYYPVSKDSSASDKKLRQGITRIFGKLKSLGNKFNKRVIFTEMGYRSSQYPWMSSYEPEDDRKKINFESQKRIYSLILDGIEKERWLKGFYIWKWPSYLEYNVNQNYDAYTPMNKPAEDVIAELFSRIKN